MRVPHRLFNDRRIGPVRRSRVLRSSVRAPGGWHKLRGALGFFRGIEAEQAFRDFRPASAVGFGVEEAEIRFQVLTIIRRQRIARGWFVQELLLLFHAQPPQQPYRSQIRLLTVIPPLVRAQMGVRRLAGPCQIVRQVIWQISYAPA